MPYLPLVWTSGQLMGGGFSSFSCPSHISRAHHFVCSFRAAEECTTHSTIRFVSVVVLFSPLFSFSHSSLYFCFFFPGMSLAGWRCLFRVTVTHAAWLWSPGVFQYKQPQRTVLSTAPTPRPTLSTFRSTQPIKAVLRRISDVSPKQPAWHRRCSAMSLSTEYTGVTVHSHSTIWHSESGWFSN